MRYEVHESAVLPPRAATFLAIAALHVAFVYLFMSGLAQSAFKEIAERIQVVEVPDAPPPDPPKAVPAPRWDDPVTIVMEPPIVPPDSVPEETTAPATTFVSDPAPVAEPAVMQRVPEPIIVTGAHRLPNTEDYYPAQEIRLGKEGAVDVRVCVNENGRLQGEPTILRSSGNAALDRGAVNVARDGRYARSTQGGHPVPNCHAFRIIFEVNER